jgi:hypothetical protein
MSKKKPKAPPPPPPPSYGELWKEYSSWTARSKSQLEKGVSDVRAKMSMAGADKSVIDAAVADRQSAYNSEIAKYQASSTYKLLQEGYDIARGAKKNPYSGKAAGQLYNPDGPLEDYTTTTRKRQAGRDGGWKNVTTTRQRGALNSLEGFYAGGYESGEVEVDAKEEARKKSKLNAGGSGGTATITGYEKQKEPGTNPWVV